MGSRNEGCSKAPAASAVVAFTHTHTFAGKLAKLDRGKKICIYPTSAGEFY